jgi:HlyD family secretion protein
MKTPLFRNNALERLSSPEQLDKLLTVTTPKGWLALAALCGFLCTAVAWGVSGTVATRVSGQGVIMATGGVLNVVSVGAGRVTAIRVRPGDPVRKGQVIATLTDPSLAQKVAGAQAELDAARKELVEMTHLNNTGVQLQLDVLVRERGTTSARIAELTRQVQNWREQAAAHGQQAESLRRGR